MTHTKKLIYIGFDFLILNLALSLTYYWFFDGSGFVTTREFKGVTILVNLLWFSTLFYTNRMYTQFKYTTLKQEIKSLIPNYFIYILLFYALSISLFQSDGFIFNFYYGILLVLLLAGRIFLKYIISRISRHKTLNYITIGHCDTLSKIEKTLDESHQGKIHHVGSFGDSPTYTKNFIGAVEDIDDFLEKNQVNLILYVSNALPPSVLRHLMHYARQNFIEFKIIPLEMDILTEGTKLELHNGIFLSAKDEFVAAYKDSLWKRLFDIMFSLCVIVFILSWLLPLICLAICIESKGSPIFIQDRVGFRGKIFKCIKFRSLRVQEHGMSFKQVKCNDSRITKVGAFIRKSNLDEMPQFLNVLMGDMSIVGPRPHPIKLDFELKNTTEEYILRHYTKPGITGWAQVNGWRGPTDTYHKIITRTQHDLWYLQNRSLKLDIKIIFLTVFGSKVRENAF